MVCYDPTLIKYPWLSPPKGMKTGECGNGAWENEYSAVFPNSVSTEDSLAHNLRMLFKDELPAFYMAINDNEVFHSARINRRVTWLKMNPDKGSYSTQDGRVTLIGDAAHAMTPSMGEGCNTALESAVKLFDIIEARTKRNGEVICSVNTISDAFIEYGSSRPTETKQIQEESAARNMGPQ